MRTLKRLAALLAVLLLAGMLCGAGAGVSGSFLAMENSGRRALEATGDSGVSGDDSTPEPQPAAGGLEMDWRGTSATAFLREKVPEPALGDELVLFALLRSGQATADEAMVEGYVTARLEALAEAEDTGKQTRRESAWQMLALSAAGVNVNIDAPVLVNHFSDMEALNAEGTDAMRLALLVFGPAGVTPPEGFDAVLLAQHLAGARNLDGGYGAEGVSDPVNTARALQALAFYRNDDAVEDGVAAARAWLRQNQAPYGGFEMEGSPSGTATAESVIALRCLTETVLQQGAPDPADLLRVFQNEVGAFVPDPDAKPDVELTALSLLALASTARLDAQKVPVYRLSDVERPAFTAAADDTSEPLDKLLEEAPISIPGLPPLSNGVLVAILVGTVALIVLLAALVSGGRDMRRRKKRRQRMEELRASGQLPPGVDIDDEDWELDIDYEYVGDELEPPPDAAGQQPEGPDAPPTEHIPGGRPRRR
ncbi:hypothetical protein LJC60_03370 [Ruminococcaceae bacterium OttesenSCG-928-D13]|nr:hypothetical protein [Ruminococcaceae bacterium OttesenSCG-928-D13]